MEIRKEISVACNEIQNLQKIVIKRNRDAGWWTDLKTGEPKDRNKGELLCLIHSEVSEAMEGMRKDLMDDHLPSRKMEEVELADTIIRILDYAGGFGLDVAGAIEEKLEYNKNRLDHKIENRIKDGGKKI
jgi:NTP pyrophosphatase (non-canonical NTP hydrolase)